MNTTCNACGVNVQIDIERNAGIRYCAACKLRAKATWQLRTAVLYAERAGLPEADALRRIADRIALKGSFTRTEVLQGGWKRTA